MAETATINMPAAQAHAGGLAEASQARTEGRVPSGPLEKVMRVAVEHAAPQRAVLVVLRGREPWIEVEARAGLRGIEVAVRGAPVTADDLPVSVLSHVLRTGEPLVLDEALLEDLVPHDGYTRTLRSRSVTCLPVLGEAHLLGALYLESGPTTPVLDAGRSAVLDLLVSQVAVALENAQLRRDLRHTHDRCAEAERLSLAGSFCWNILSGTFVLSAQALRLFDFEPAGTVSLDALASRIHPEDVPLFREMAESARRRADRLDCLCRARMPDHSIKHLRFVAHLAPDEEGHAAYVGAVQDVTQAQRADEALAKARAELAHLARVTSLGALAASITHELNQPLTGIVMNGSACLRMLATEPANLQGARETVRRTIRDGHRAADVIARLRALFTKGDCTQGSVDLNEAVREVMVISRSEVDQAGVILRSELSDDLPKVAGDRIQLEQVDPEPSPECVRSDGRDHRPSPAGDDLNGHRWR